jgi:hypothetical protein
MTNKWANQFGNGKLSDKKTSVWGKKLLGGYAGVKWTAENIMNLSPNLFKENPNYDLYVEPFAGLGRTAEYVELPIVLNDKSQFSNNYCSDIYPNAIVENMDFMETIDKYDSDKTFFLIDPPWRYATYNINDKAFCDRKTFEYYDELLKRVETLKGDWFILSSADEHETRNILRKSRWGIKIVESEGNVIFGKKARTMICSNIFNPEIKEKWVSSSK